MKTDIDRISDLLNYLKVSKNKLGVSIGDKNGMRFQNILSGRNGISEKLAKDITDVYTNISYDWLFRGEGQMLKEGNISNVIKKQYKNHIEVKIINTKAQAGYMDSYYSDEYLKDLPTILIEAEQEYKGNYLVFEVSGDSMEPEYFEGDLVICREVQRHLWSYKLHIKDWDFVIAHSTKGIVLKEITDHDVETGIITCHSLNDYYPDFKYNLKEVAFLYNVVEHRRSGRNKRRKR